MLAEDFSEGGTDPGLLGKLHSQTCSVRLFSGWLVGKVMKKGCTTFTCYVLEITGDQQIQANSLDQHAILPQNNTLRYCTNAI